MEEVATYIYDPNVAMQSPSRASFLVNRVVGIAMPMEGIPTLIHLKGKWAPNPHSHAAHE